MTHQNIGIKKLRWTEDILFYIGLTIYLTYGVRHSVEGKRNSQDWPDLRNTEPEICLQKSQDYSEPRKEWSRVILKMNLRLRIDQNQ